MIKIRLISGDEFELHQPDDWPEGEIRDAFCAGYTDGLMAAVAMEERERLGTNPLVKKDYPKK